MPRSTPRTKTPISLPSTSSLTGLQLNTSNSSDTRKPLPRTSRFSTPPTLPTMSTGETMEPSPELRTRDNADHAGHSPPLVPLKVLTSSLQETSSPSQSNNLLTAPPPTVAAMVVTWELLSPTPRMPLSGLKIPIPTPLRMVNANTYKDKELLVPPATLTFPPTTTLN